MSKSALLGLGGGGALGALTDVADDDPADNDVLTWDESAGEWVPAAPPGAVGGEANTASNVGTGAGVFKTKTGVDLRFRSLLTTAGAGLTITQGVDEVTVEIDDSVVALIADLVASDVTFTPAGSISSGTVQDALEELDASIPEADSYVLATGGGKEAVSANATATGVTTINLNDGNYHKLTLTGPVTLSVANVTDAKACSFFLHLKQDGTGGRATTWWSGITWVGLSSAPTLSTVAAADELFSFVSIDGGVSWFGFYLSGTVGYGEVQASIPGAVAVVAGGSRIYNNSGKARTIVGVRASVGTAPTGASLIVDVNKNGTTIFTGGTDRPEIAISGFTDVGTPAVTSWANGDYLTVDVDQVGSTVAGSNLVVQIYYSEG